MASLDELPDIPYVSDDQALPENGNDSDDPNVPSDDQGERTPPIADPTRDMEATLSDDDLSELSDVDEAEFVEFDPASIAIEDKPIAIDEDNIHAIGRHKRKRGEGEDGEGKKKRKEARRGKARRKQNEDSEDDNFSGGEEIKGKRRLKRGTGDDGESAPRRKVREETPDEELSDGARRKRDLDRRLDAALKNPNRSRRRKHDGDNVDTNADEDARDLYNRMQAAAAGDNASRTGNPPQPALRKLKLLPEAVSFLNRDGDAIENAITDSNLLEAVRFFLEPLGDASMPAYNIQRELWGTLSKMQITKDNLMASGLGKLAIFYTKSKKVQPEISRQADRLLAEWTRLVLKRSDNYRNRALEQRVYDPDARKSKAKVSRPHQETADERRKRELMTPRFQNRAVMDTTQKSYTVVPMSQVPLGNIAPRAAGDDAFKRLKARHTADQRAKSGLKPKKKGNAI